MSLVHNNIKMRLVREGYLPNYPYHMISDEEMCDAFLHMQEDGNSIQGLFADYYPCIDDSLSSAYNELVSSILYHIDKLKSSNDDSYTLPDWVYSYMLGSVIGPSSEIIDIHDMLVLMDKDNREDTFTVQASKECLRISKQWLKKVSKDKLDHRPPTMFGEPHVIKSLRLLSVSVSV